MDVTELGLMTRVYRPSARSVCVCVCAFGLEKRATQCETHQSGATLETKRPNKSMGIFEVSRTKSIDLDLEGTFSSPAAFSSIWYSSLRPGQASVFDPDAWWPYRTQAKRETSGGRGFGRGGVEQRWRWWIGFWPTSFLDDFH